MKKIICSLVLMFLSVSFVFAQTNTGVLKIFSEDPVIVYVDQIHYPNYNEISLVAGTHYVKVLDKDEIKVYSQIVAIVANEVNSILIESVKAVEMVKLNEEYKMSPTTETKPILPVQTIDIGQVKGILPADMSGPYGLVFGMSTSQVDGIMTPIAAQVMKNRGFNQYAFYTKDQSSVFIVECRFIDSKLFTVIVGYPAIIVNNNKVKLDKTQVPIIEFENMYADLVSIYGEPTKVTKEYRDGYAENDGRLIEALKKKKALIVYEWIDPATGNDIMLTVAYTTAPLAAVIYLSGPLGKEAQNRKLKLNSYDYTNSYEYNYFNK